MTAPAITTDAVTIHLGNCLDILREMPDASIDAIVTDPPYGLSNTDPAHVVEALTQWATGNRTFVPTGRGFMGKSWDAFVPPPAVWDECFRVLKPGGHLLAFAGSRTFDLMTLSIRFAGFDIRDGIAWLYGSGFPKSLDVSKAIEKRRVEDLEPTRVVCRAIRAAMDAAGVRSRDLVQHFDGCHPRLIDHWAARDTDSQPSLPKWDQWETLRRVLPSLGADLDAEVWRLNGRKGSPGDVWDSREVVGEQTSGIHSAFDYARFGEPGKSKTFDLTAPATDAGARWQGWGTALKPAFEPIVVARKPLIGTVAANVLAHGTGALNIDGTRVAHGGDVDLSRQQVNFDRMGYMGTEAGTAGVSTYKPEGRWPANVLLDGSQADALDEQSGVLKAPRSNGSKTAEGMNGTDTFRIHAREQKPGRADDGGASRFFPVFPREFDCCDGDTTPSNAEGSSDLSASDPDLPTFRYQAKAPTRERPVHIAEDGTKTAHPTVKPLALMRWLVKLVTPPGGVVLDPFVGSGTTVESAAMEGFQSIGIEGEADYLPLIQQRLDRLPTE